MASDLPVDRQLAAYLGANGHPRSPATLRSWRETAHLFEPRRLSRYGAPATPDEYAAALGIAQAFDSGGPERVTADAAAVAAWGELAPIWDGQELSDGLRGALVRQLGAAMTDLRLATLGDTNKGRRARSKLLTYSPKPAVEAVAAVMLGDHPAPGGVVELVQATGLGPLYEQVGLIRHSWASVASDHEGSPRAPLRPTARALASAQDVPMADALIERALHATRAELDQYRDQAREVRRVRQERGEWDNASDSPPGWGVAILALYLAAMPDNKAGRVIAALIGAPAGFTPLHRGIPRRGRPALKHRPAVEHQGRTTLPRGGR